MDAAKCGQSGADEKSREHDRTRGVVRKCGSVSGTTEQRMVDDGRWEEADEGRWRRRVTNQEAGRKLLVLLAAVGERSLSGGMVKVWSTWWNQVQDVIDCLAGTALANEIRHQLAVVASVRGVTYLVVGAL